MSHRRQIRKHGPPVKIFGREALNAGDERAPPGMKTRRGKGLCGLGDRGRVGVDGNHGSLARRKPRLGEKTRPAADVDGWSVAQPIDGGQAHRRGGVIVRAKPLSAMLDEFARCRWGGCVLIGPSIPAGDQPGGGVGNNRRCRGRAGRQRAPLECTCCGRVIQPRCADQPLFTPAKRLQIDECSEDRRDV